jgi:serine/threonine protein kinase
VNELSGYVFLPLREGDISLYRGSGNGLAPILLVAAEETSPGCVEGLEHEYALKGELDADWAARPIALTHYNDRMTLVLEDPGGTSLDRLLGRPLDVSHFLRIAIPLAGALRRVHERGLIHKDIKPVNILADAVSGGVWLTGFGIASRLPREHQAAAPPEVIAGTLAYMAPEQTGRMNRSVDSRSDLYALGVTFYEMLTGTLPFTAADPMEWVHCHIARQPMPPNERVAGIPGMLSAIVMKLLAKTAEVRYQTAAGVEADVKRCLAEWESHGCESARRSDPTRISDVRDLACRSASDPHADAHCLADRNGKAARHRSKTVPCRRPHQTRQWVADGEDRRIVALGMGPNKTKSVLRPNHLFHQFGGSASETSCASLASA